MSTHEGRFLEMGDRETPRLFAPSLREAIEDDPEVVGLDTAVEQLELWGLEAQYTEVGHPAYPPKAMLKVLIYGYCLGLRSSRMLERACKRDDAFRFLAHGLRPDHNSICRFRRRHVKQLPELFSQTVRLCQGAGLVSLGQVAVDGTKLRANRSRQTLAKAKRQFEEALKEAEQADGQEAEQQECEFMKTAEGLQPAYNAQAAVDGEHQVIVAEDVSRSPNDSGHLIPMVAQTLQGCGSLPERVMADGSYYTREAVKQVEGMGTEVYLPTPEPGQAKVEWVEEKRAYRCMMGHWLGPARVWRGKLIYQYCGCGRCPKKQACGVKGKTKRVYVWLADTPVGRLQARMKTADGQAIYAARKQIVEPVFGRFKHNRGFRRLLLRGLSGARIEWALMCMAHNLRKWVQAVGPDRSGAQVLARFASWLAHVTESIAHRPAAPLPIKAARRHCTHPRLACAILHNAL